MDPNDVRGRITDLLYATQFDKNLDDPARLGLIVDSIRAQRNFRHSAAEYSEAISSVLADGHLPSQVIPVAHSEDSVLSWLGRLAQQLRLDSKGTPTARGM